MQLTGALEVYADGSGTVGSGPACIGVVVTRRGKILCECSAYICDGTNNVAELWALRRALYLIRWVGELGAVTPAVIYSDSEYAIGCATAVYKPSKNVELVYAIQHQVTKHRGFVTFQHVRGHSGVPGNELADWLAGLARWRRLGGKCRQRPCSDLEL